MASPAVKPTRRTDVVAMSALVLSIFCSAGLVHVEFRLYSDRQLVNAADAVLTREERGTISPQGNKQGSEETVDIRPVHEKTAHEQQQQDGSVVQTRTKRAANATLHDVIRQSIQQQLQGLVTKCVANQRLGVKGSRGKRGRQGVRGKHGPAGSPGDRGDQGHVGPPGPPGPKGDRGDEGPKGEPGPSISAPTMVDPPRSQVVNETSPVSFVCDVQGNPKPQITWSKLNSVLPAGRHVTGSGGGLIIKEARSHDEGVYTCTGRSALGSVTASATLTVQVGAKISQPFAPVILEERQNATFACDATGRPQPLITWSRIFNTLPSSHRVAGGNLIMWNLIQQDSGMYVCQASNLLNSDTAHVQLTVMPFLQFITRPPSAKTVLPSRDMSLTCLAVGATQLAWQRTSGKPLPIGHVIYPNGTLLLKKVKKGDEGEYSCTARNFRRSIQASTTLKMIMRTCSELKSRDPFASSGSYVIDPDGPGDVASLTVYCNMTDKGGVGVTVISHDAETRTYVDQVPACGPPGSTEKGCYSKDVHYTGASTAQLTNLTAISANCEQFIKFECHNYVLFVADSHAWWVSRDGNRINYWGGATSGSNKCACGMTDSCKGGKGCNCDNADSGDWREDSGLLTDKSTLPVSQIRIGDLDDSNEKGYHTLGKFKCYG